MAEFDFPDILLDTLLDTAKLLPFLFLTYLLMEFLEHRAGNATGRLLGSSGRVGPLIGGLLGWWAGREAGEGAGKLVYSDPVSESQMSWPIQIDNRITLEVDGEPMARKVESYIADYGLRY